MNLYSSPPATSSSTTPAPSKMTFASIVTSLSEEANRLRGELKLNGPGSEYANATSFKPQEGKTNPKTGIRIHKYNPKGVCCDNPVCTGLPRSLTHDREHCFQPGGGMEGQGGIRNRDRDRDRKPSKKSDIAAAANSNDTPASTTSSSSSATSAVEHESDTPSFDDIACIAQQTLSTILDSGTTSNLIMDRSYFMVTSQPLDGATVSRTSPLAIAHSGSHSLTVCTPQVP